jgi:hypothetical protein
LIAFASFFSCKKKRLLFCNSVPLPSRHHLSLDFSFPCQHRIGTSSLGSSVLVWNVAPKLAADGTPDATAVWRLISSAHQAPAQLHRPIFARTDAFLISSSGARQLSCCRLSLVLLTGRSSGGFLDAFLGMVVPDFFVENSPTCLQHVLGVSPRCFCTRAF